LNFGTPENNKNNGSNNYNNTTNNINNINNSSSKKSITSNFSELERKTTYFESSNKIQSLKKNSGIILNTDTNTNTNTNSNQKTRKTFNMTAPNISSHNTNQNLYIPCVNCNNLVHIDQIGKLNYNKNIFR
jgi:hypothetical protein